MHKGKEDYFRQKDYLHDVEICQQFVRRNRAEMGTLYNHILNHNLTVITLMIAAVRSAVMAAKRVWRIFLTRIQPKYIAIA